jgi:sarcosine oxidase delta subunit
MSSYLTFYLVPKKTKKQSVYNNEEGHTEKEITLSEGKPLILMSFSRNSDVYQAYYETLNPAYCGTEEKYTEITYADSQRVTKEFENDIKKTEQRLEISYKMLKEGGYSSELWEEIQSTEEYLREQKETLEELKHISNIIYEVTEGYNDFEKVLINID